MNNTPSAEVAPATFANTASRWDLPLRIVALAVWLGFVLFCVGLVVSHGICCADDAWFAIIAKSVARGLGYATTFAKDVEALQPILFNPTTGTGPALILPCAVAIKLFGVGDLVPGLTAVVCWAGALTALLLLLSRHTDGGSLLLGVASFCFAVFGTFAYHFEQWFAFIGEVPAAALLLVAHWLIAAEKFGHRAVFLSGLCMGLAVQTKYQAVIATAGAFIIFVLQLKRCGGGWRDAGRMVALLLAGCALPTALFELYKLSQLGLDGYGRNWQEFLVASREMGMQSGAGVTMQLLQERMAVLYDRFALRWWGVLGVIAVAAVLFWRSAAERWRMFFTALALSVLVSGVYWAALSVGRPRYAITTITMICFLFAVPVFGVVRVWQKLLCTALAAVILSTGIQRASYVLKLADRGLFRPSSERLARAGLVDRIQSIQAREPVQLASRYWGSFADIEFLLPQSMNFRRIESVEGDPRKKLILINSRFNELSDYGIVSARQRASSVLFSGGPYELLEVP
ncbi:MAG: hypothetical protein H0W20_02700 [Chthoniobacterales bacterium]|nr:hypothetical protein [Chthoniobacterales bacterium]